VTEGGEKEKSDSPTASGLTVLSDGRSTNKLLTEKRRKRYTRYPSGAELKNPTGGGDLKRGGSRNFSPGEAERKNPVLERE